MASTAQPRNRRRARSATKSSGPSSPEPGAAKQDAPPSARWYRSTAALAMLSGMLLYAAFPPLGWWPLAWIAPLGWLLLIRARSCRAVVLTSCCGQPRLFMAAAVPLRAAAALDGGDRLVCALVLSRLLFPGVCRSVARRSASPADSAGCGGAARVGRPRTVSRTFSLRSVGRVIGTFASRLDGADSNCRRGRRLRTKRAGDARRRVACLHVALGRQTLATVAGGAGGNRGRSSIALWPVSVRRTVAPCISTRPRRE